MSVLTLVPTRRGLHLPRLGLWLDARDPVDPTELVVVSHAHTDHLGARGRLLASRPTAVFLQARLREAGPVEVLPWGERRSLTAPDGTPFHLTLRPAGHILGSAMAHLEAGGQSLLSTGDFKLRPNRAAEPCTPHPADLLVMETTFGRPEYRFPPTEEVMAGVIRFCRETLGEGQTALLLGYALGKCQEILAWLADAGLPVALHPEVYRLTRLYEQLGWQFPPYARLEGDAGRGCVVLCPPGVARAPLLRQLGPVRTAVLTGWALNPHCRFQYGADAAFPVSDHADFPELLELVERVAPRQVLTVHGFAADFAACLRERGWEARALSGAEQLTLPLALPRPTPPAPGRRPPPPAPAVPEPEPSTVTAFAAFARTCAAVAACTSRRDKVTRLAAYLRSLPPDLLSRVAVWLGGPPFAPIESRPLQVGGALRRRALCAVTGVDEATFRQVYLRHSDTGETAAELRQGQTPDAPPLECGEVAHTLERIAAARGPAARCALLEPLLARCHAGELKYLIKILTGDLRIGLKGGLVEEALAEAFGVEPEAIRRAHLLRGHPGEVAVLAQRGELAGVDLEPLRPVLCMLASPEPNAAAVWARARAEFAAGPEAPAWVEDKDDGLRCQLHRVGARVALFSRDLKDLTAAFPEVVEAARRLPADVILDGELLALDGDRPLPSATLQRRLGRRETDLLLGAEVPVGLVVFDLLWCAGESLLDRPLRERRGRLETLAPLPAPLRLARHTPATSPEDIEAAFGAARARDNEGLIIKNPASPYTPGRRGLAWLKLKKACATLDCVVVGAEYGHGKRRAVLSDYTFAVREGPHGRLLTIGKAYSGLSDEEIARLTPHFLSRVIRQRGRYHEVEPDVVIEVAFDHIQPSARHASGLALRFPRIARLRPDKTVADIDTLATARRLAGLEAPVPAAASLTPAP